MTARAPVELITFDCRIILIDLKKYLTHYLYLHIEGRKRLAKLLGSAAVWRGSPRFDWSEKVNLEI